MNHRGYPTSLASLRLKLEKLLTLPDNSPAWTAFTRDEMRLAPWLLPAVQAAVRQETWRSASDPVIQLRSAVHRLAIEMRLRNHDKPLVDLDEDPDES